MLRSFESGNLRILIRYFEHAKFKDGNPDIVDGTTNLVKQVNWISGIEIINTETKELVRLSEHEANAIAENIKEINTEIPQPIHIDDIELG